MTHKAWSGIDEECYCFSRSFVNLLYHTGQKIDDFDSNWAFPDCNSSLNSKMKAYEIMHKAWSGIEDVPYCFSRSFVNFVGHTGGNIDYLAPILAFPDNNSNLNKWMDMKWHAYLLGARKRLPVVLEVICQILSSHGMKNRFESYSRSQLSDPSELPCYDLFQFLGKQFMDILYQPYTMISFTRKIHI